MTSLAVSAAMSSWRCWLRRYSASKSTPWSGGYIQRCANRSAPPVGVLADRRAASTSAPVSASSRYGQTSSAAPRRYCAPLTPPCTEPRRLVRRRATPATSLKRWCDARSPPAVPRSRFGRECPLAGGAMRVALQIAQDRGQPGPRPRAATLDGAFGDPEQLGGVGDRIAVHVNGDHRGALLGGQSHQCPLHRDRGVDLRGPIRHRKAVVEDSGRVSLVAAQPIQASIDDDAVQPTADRGMVPKRSGAAVRRDHRLLQRVLGVLGATAAQPGDPVQLPVVAEEQLLESIAIARGVSRQQL